MVLLWQNSLTFDIEEIDVIIQLKAMQPAWLFEIQTNLKNRKIQEYTLWWLGFRKETFEEYQI